MRGVVLSDIRNAVKQSLKTLLETTPYEKITVSDICGSAGISRRTFYKYFSKTEEIVIAQIQDDFITPVREIRNLLPVDEIKSSMILMLEMMSATAYNHKEYYRGLLHFRGHNTLVEAIVTEVSALNAELYVSRIESSEERAFVSYAFGWVPSILLLWWIDKGNETDPKTMAKYIERWLFSHWREIDRDKFE
jgi:AcrR family transcriptional regulator